MPVTIKKADATSRELLRHLFSLYLHDLSEFADLSIREDGLFHYEGFDLIWEKDQVVPLLIYADGQVAGFLLLCSPPFTSADVDYCIHEFFILRSYRRKGIASRAVTLLFQTYPGRYKLAQLKQNIAAIQFWKKVYRIYAIVFEEKEVVLHNHLCLEQRFQVGPQ